MEENCRADALANAETSLIVNEFSLDIGVALSPPWLEIVQKVAIQNC